MNAEFTHRRELRNIFDLYHSHNGWGVAFLYDTSNNIDRTNSNGVIQVESFVPDHSLLRREAFLDGTKNKLREQYEAEERKREAKFLSFYKDYIVTHDPRHLNYGQSSVERFCLVAVGVAPRECVDFYDDNAAHQVDAYGWDILKVGLRNGYKPIFRTANYPFMCVGGSNPDLDDLVGGNVHGLGELAERLEAEIAEEKAREEAGTKVAEAVQAPVQ